MKLAAIALGENNIISKGELLRKLECSANIDEELLKALSIPLKKSLLPEDWVEYAALCKLDGESHKEIMEKTGYSDSWIKKYVNRKIKEDTQVIPVEPEIVTIDDILQARHIHTILDFSLGELKKETRRFSGWGSVEVKDSQSDKLPIEALKKIMPIYMQRGAPIMFGHSNRHVGKILKYEFRDKEVDGKSIPGLWLEGIIFSNYKIDDQAWDSIQLAKQTGKAVLSLGATPLGVPKFECAGNECFRKFDDLQIYEFTVTDLARGQQGANPEATIEMALAKSLNLNQEVSSMNTKIEKGIPLSRSASQSTVVWKPEWGQMQREYPKKIQQFERQLAAKKDEAKRSKSEMDSIARDYQNKLKAFQRDAKQRESTYDKEIAVIEEKIKNLKEKLATIGKADKELAQETATELIKAIDEWNQLTNPLGSVVGGRLLKMEQEKTLPAHNTELINLMLSSCPSCQSQYNTLLKSGLSEAEAKDSLLGELMNALEIAKEEYNEMNEVDKEGETDLAAVLQQLAKGQQEIIALLNKQGEKAPPSEKDEEEEEEESDSEEESKADKEEDKEKEPVLTLSKFNLDQDSFAELAKKMGYTRVGQGPAPVITPEREVTKGNTGQKSKLPTVEENLEAMRRLDFSKLRGE